MIRPRALAWPFVCALALAACGTPTSSGTPKVDLDASKDAPADAAPDLAPPPDVAPPPDAAPDLTPPPDAAPDVAPDVAPDAPADVAPEGPQCMPTELACDGRCVNGQSDNAHCGMCSNACPMGQMCMAGACSPICPAGQSMCGTSCVDLQTSFGNCGACGVTCPLGQSCSAGRCQCPGGQMVCGAGCVDTSSNALHCGVCDNACPRGQMCSMGRCQTTCSAGQTLCNAAMGPGECVDAQTSVTHCGRCGNACATGQTCAAGACRVTATTRYRAEERPAGVAFLNACTQPGASSYLPGADDSFTLVTMPFAFRYWATDRPAGSMVNITSNGWIGLDGVGSATYAFAIPSTATPNAVVAAYEGDDYNRNAQCVAVAGLAPSRRWIHTWNDSAHCCDPSATGAHNTYSIYLNESSNVIEFVYSTMNGARAQWVGLENQTGSAGVGGCPGGAYNCTPVAGYAVRFVPIP